jgi:hypothetical protein
VFIISYGSTMEYLEAPDQLERRIFNTMLFEGVQDFENAFDIPSAMNKFRLGSF